MYTIFKRIKSFFISLLITVLIKISIVLHRLERDLFKYRSEGDLSGDIEIKDIQSDLLRSLYKGEYNKQYVDKFYKILKTSDDILYKRNNENLLETVKKHGMDLDNYELINLIDNRNKRINDSTPKYPLVDVVRNRVEILELNSLINNKETKKITTIKSRDSNRTNKIEEFTESLSVYKYDENQYLLSFIILNEDNIILDDINNVYYSDKYGINVDYTVTEKLNTVHVEAKNIKITTYLAKRI